MLSALPSSLGVPRLSHSTMGHWLDSSVQQLTQPRGPGRGQALTLVYRGAQVQDYLNPT